MIPLGNSSGRQFISKDLRVGVRGTTDINIHVTDNNPLSNKMFNEVTYFLLVNRTSIFSFRRGLLNIKRVPIYLRTITSRHLDVSVKI